MFKRRATRQLYQPDGPTLRLKDTATSSYSGLSHQFVGYSNQGLRELGESLHEVAVSHNAVGQQRHALQKVIPRLGRGAEVAANRGVTAFEKVSTSRLV